MEQQELDLREIFHILRRRIWVILVIPLIAAITSGLVSVYVMEPVYSASTTLWVIKEGTGQINLNDVMLSRNLTKTYSEVAKSRAVMTDVIKSLGLQGISVSGLQRKLTVTPVRDTEILSFTVEDGNPEMAARLANAVAEAFKGQIRTYMKVENVVVVDLALVPSGPVRPRPVLNIMIAVVLAGLFAIGLVFLMEYLDTSIKTPEDVSRYLKVPVLGIIPLIEPAKAENLPKRTRSRAQQAKTAVEK